MFLYALGLFVAMLCACGSAEDRPPAKRAITKTVPPAGDSVMVGAEVLLDQYLDKLKGKRVGLVMNPTARVEGVHMLDTLLARGVNVTALFAPEHGFRGEAGAGETIEGGIDRATGLPVYSLYGATRRPTPAMLQQVDILLFDMQGVGARFYTYNVTLGRLLEAAAETKVPVWVLDRPNPAGGQYVAGWVLDEAYESFVGAYPIPMAHGMTLGELARMMVGEQWLRVNGRPQLRVIPMKGWKRSMLWPQTGLHWYPPSPNLPTFEHAYAYLGTVLFEGTTLSEGRGTPDPFLTIGAPGTRLAAHQLDSLERHFDGIRIEQTRFTPHSIAGKARHPKHEGELCRGVSLQITDFESFRPVGFGVALLELMVEQTPGAQITDFIYKLAGTRRVASFEPDWENEVRAFRNARAPYLIYE